MTKRLLSGNEAVARGAWEAGVEIASAYPGTPSTEILENFAPMPHIYAEWAPNEKVALDVAVGAAYNGRRAMAVMKHVGLNVAADAFWYVALSGVDGGLVIVIADDVGLHSSQNEQDNRHMARFARVPCIDPSDSQEAKDFVKLALELSEEFRTPVLYRLTTRISHTNTPVEIAEVTRTPLEPLEGAPPYKENPSGYVMMPANAARQHLVLEERVAKLAEFAATSPLNRVEMGDTKLGIVTCGIAYQYAREVFPNASFLKLGMTFPLSPQLIKDFAARVDRLIVIEELDPIIEEQIKLMGVECEGKSIFPLHYEFNPQIVRNSAIAAGLLPETERVAPVKVDKGELPVRPPVLCPGCPHRPVFHVLKQAKVAVNGDIGCYTLGTLSPLSAMHTCGCMGASIGVAHGADKSLREGKTVASIGDSTFLHTGMPALLNVTYNKGTTLTIIHDNRITAMTGHQENPGTGKTLQNEDTIEVDFEQLVRALGIEKVQTVDSYKYKELRQVLRDAIKSDEPEVVITKRECALLRPVRKTYLPLRVDREKCVACWSCIRTGCPALRKSNEIYETNNRAKSDIDPLLCTGCELCAQLCPTGAILFREQILAEKEQE